MTRPIAALAVTVALATILTSCALPRVYKVTVQQGNVITQQMVDSLQPGMTREQVAFVMGEPVIKNPFDQDRWDYVYTLRVPGVVEDHMKMSLFFTDGLLSHFVGDLAPSEAQAKARDPAQATAE
ncbi:MAG: outer membrane protein assembly factor BamE [Gammaproteobacteria bacterium]|nr:outer membrane protein assembly factor BamE [Gammaproteobacteria bacterium]